MSDGDGKPRDESAAGARSADADETASDGHDALIEGVLAGNDRALARTISLIEDRAPGARRLAAALYEHAGDAHVVGVTGSPGTGKSTLVNHLAAAYRDAGEDVGVVAIDPSSPFSGGAVLGDRLRMSASRGADGVFVRSMSARGHLGGLSTATTDAIVALDAAGKDTVVVETVGAGQNEIEIVRTADTVAVLVTPGAGDAVQTLKAGILEIGDVFVVNKADLDGADRTVADLRGMLEERQSAGSQPRNPDRDPGTGEQQVSPPTTWSPPIVETVATAGDGVADLRAVLIEHAEHLRDSGEKNTRRRSRQAAQLRRILREDAAALVEDAITEHGGMDALVDRLEAGGGDPYRLASDVMATVLESADELGTASGDDDRE
jgi:LAO/AO transport system kinase